MADTTTPESTESAVTDAAAKAKNEKPREYNPRWKGYVYMSIASSVNFISISTVNSREERERHWVAATVGLFSFTFSVLVLLQDRSQKCLSPFHYTKAYDGNFEGYALLFVLVWWIVG
jgi:hypothetical protein